MKIAGATYRTDFEKLILANILVRTLKRKNECLIRMNERLTDVNNNLAKKRRFTKIELNRSEKKIIELKAEVKKLKKAIK